MADELAAEPQTQAAPAAEPAPQAPLAQQLEAATSASPEAALEATAAAPAPAQADAGWQGVREYAKANGVDLPFADDAQALQNLLQSYRQGQERNYYADLGRRVAPHAGRLSEFLQQRQAPPPQAPPAWQGPEFDKKWLNHVEKDEVTGELRTKPGYDPATAEKVQKYIDWREGFLESPEKVIAPLIEARARELIDARFAEQGQRQAAEQLVASDASWMFQSDPQGRQVFTPQGQRQLTPEGLLYARAADQLWNGGLRDVRQVHSLARAQVENAVMRQRLLQQQPAAAATAQLAAAAAPPSLGGQTTRPSAAAPPATTSQKGLSLRERLMVNLDRAGEP